MEKDPLTDTPVRARVALVDPVERRIVWSNAEAQHSDSAALGSVPPTAPDSATDAFELQLEAAIPLATTLRVAAAIAEVSDTGAPIHLQTDLVSTSQGAVQIVVSVFPLPDARVLVVSENAWQPQRHQGQNRASGRGRRRS